MTEDQKKLYDWLVLTSQLEAMSVIDIYSDMDACADFETREARNRLTEKEKDQVIYQAIIERWHDQLFQGGRIMTKCYRVRTPEQWEWLMQWFEKQDSPTGLNGYGWYGNKTVVEKNDSGMLFYADLYSYQQFKSVFDYIEVSKLMEDEKMENKNIANSTEASMPTSNKKIKDDSYVTISYSDLEKIKTSSGDAAFEGVKMEDESTKYDLKHVVDELHIPKSLVQQKIKMTEAEKAEFDKLNKDWTTLYLVINAIKDESLVHHLLFNRLFRQMTSAEDNEAQIEFARAWADPSLIEVPEKRWNVKIPPFERTDRYYYKSGGKLRWAVSSHNDEEDQQFTADELKKYGLDDDMYEKVEVTDDGTK